MLRADFARGIHAHPVLWTSKDGVRWRRSDGPSAESGDDSGARAATFVGSRLIVLGGVGPTSRLWSVADPFAGI